MDSMGLYPMPHYGWGGNGDGVGVFAQTKTGSLTLLNQAPCPSSAYQEATYICAVLSLALRPWHDNAAGRGEHLRHCWGQRYCP